MQFLLIVVISLVVLGAIAALSSIGSTDEPIVQKEGDCASCTSKTDCKLAELKEDIRRKKEEKCHHHDLTSVILLLTSSILLLSACSTKNNTAKSRFWQSFTARYNTYYNGSQAFIEGNIEKENGNKDNCTELIPLYPVANKQSRELGKGNYERAIEKAEKTIKLHSIKKRPEWNKGRRKTEKDIEWLNRREYNPFLWHAWLLLGKSQFQQGQFEEAAATFSYMSRLYQTQPAINGIARAWQAKSYTELDWLYDAEDIITKQRRDSIHYRAQKDWDYTLANYNIRAGHYEEALPYLRKVIKHEKRRKQKAREWFLMGQIQTLLNQKQEAYQSYKHVIRLNPPYELEFNARIAQTEVMPATDFKGKISKLRRMARSDNNKDYLDQVYYAIGNVYLTQRDTLHAIEAYEEGCKKATRSGIEKGVLLLKLGNVYWDKEKYADAQRCYGEAIGLLDKDRKDYKQLDERSKVLDELVPHTSAVELQDSLQRLALMSEEQRNKIIDKVIADFIKKEKEEQRAKEEEEAEKTLQQQEARNGAMNNRPGRANSQQPTAPSQQSGQWYFYNPQAVSQGKQTFQRQWGKRENKDHWQRVNQTVVNLLPESTESTDSIETSEMPEMADRQGATAPSDSIAGKEGEEPADSAANDPHKREYYLAQIPFTDEQKAESDNLIKDGLFHSGIIFKDKLDNLRLSEKALTRLTSQYADYEKNDEAWYHLFLLYSRLGRTTEANHCLAMLQSDFPSSDWTTLLSDPYFAENQRFGVHIEDSIYAATYEAFKANRHAEVKANAEISEKRFPLGQHRPKFLFIEGLSLLNDGQSKDCIERMKQVVEQYPQSEVSEMAGMIIRGVQEGKTLHGGKFDIDDVWSRRTVDMAADSTRNDTLTIERNANYVFMLVYQPDSVNHNQLLYEMAKYNFSNFLVRNFDINVEQDALGLVRMMISGFLNYDEARQYARQLYGDKAMADMLHPCRGVIISEKNLPLLGSTYSYRDYEIFFEEKLEPIAVSEEDLLDEPDTIVTEDDYEEDQQPSTDSQQPDDDPLFNDMPQQQSNTYDEFDDDFWR
jgi:tetratricopeptide (TPR) repeat protein